VKERDRVRENGCDGKLMDPSSANLYTGQCQQCECNVTMLIRPDIDAVEMLAQLLKMENSEPYVQHEVIIVGVGFWAVAEEVEVLARPISVMPILQHHDTILHGGVILLVAAFWGEINGGEIHQH